MTDFSAPLGRARLSVMRPREPHEPHRAASSLELFFDLVFVVAVSTAAGQLHHALSEGHVASGVLSYLLVFFAIWWAWMNFTWFATSFDTDDWLYRVLTILQMSGVLVLAAGVSAAFNEGDFRLPVIGYVIMRVAMVAQWLRAAKNAGQARVTALMYAVGIAVVQVFWLLLLLVQHDRTLFLIGFVIGAVAEILVPVVAERRGHTNWHPHHITERYGLFTLILLGESLLASSNAIIEALQEADSVAPLIGIAALALVSTAALWWIYFWPPHHSAIGSTLGQSLRYGYVHFFVFAAAGAFSAGVEAEIDALTHHSALSPLATSFTVTVPVAIFLLGIWWIAIRQHADRVVNIAVPIAAVLVLLDPVLPVPVALTAVILVGVVALLVVRPPVDRRSVSTIG